MLAEYFRTQGFDRFEVVSGERRKGKGPLRRWTSHAWLEGYGLVVDITADQFADVSTKVIVVTGSAWHGRFLEQRRRSPGISEYACAAQLWRAYAAITDAIRA